MNSEYYNLGTHSRRVTTQSPAAQRWFDRGLVWSYGFNHEEAARCFEAAIDADPQCAMAYWGLAYVLGPNYNKPWKIFDRREMETALQRAHAATLRATEEAVYASPVEKALVHALHARYPKASGPEGAREETSIWNQDYAAAMRAVYREFPGDSDIASLVCDALMNLSPWKLWDLNTGKPVEGTCTLEIKAILERALARDPHHPGLIHLYIHLMEMSSEPETALSLANNLRGLVPDAGHLNHMPTHLDILAGRYAEAIESNTQAIVADDKFLRRRGPRNFYSLYRCHDFHFLIYAAMFAGRYRVAIETVALLEASVPEDLLRLESPPMADWLEGFLSMRVHVFVRFGRWDDLIQLATPPRSNLLCMTTAMIHYGRGVAFAATGRVPEAQHEEAMFLAAVETVPESRTLFNNTCLDILGIAGAMLRGEIEYRRGNIESAFEHLRKAIELDDSLPYDEPWGWMQPTRHAYGALLLEQGRVKEACDVYEADLGYNDTLPRAFQHRNNVWALHGYHECLQKLERTEEAHKVAQLLAKASAGADVRITSSCFCRLATSNLCRI